MIGMGPSPKTVVLVTRFRDAIKAAIADPEVPDSICEVLRQLDRLTNEEIPRV